MHVVYVFLPHVEKCTINTTKTPVINDDLSHRLSSDNITNIEQKVIFHVINYATDESYNVIEIFHH